MLPLLEEEQCRSLPEDRRVLYVLQWLQSLPQAIKTAAKVRLHRWYSRVAKLNLDEIGVEGMSVGQG